MHKTAYIVLLALLATTVASAQSLYHVSHTTGKLQIGGIDVTVNPINNAYPYSGSGGNFCGAGPYFIGQGTGGASSTGYQFIFSKPINAARFQITASEVGEAISFDINRMPYTITNSQVSNYTGYCGSPNGWIVSGGQLMFNVVASNNSQVYIADSISDITIYDLNWSAGSIFSFDFLLDTTTYIDSITSFVGCIGDTFNVNYTAAGTFFNGNQFKLLLSDKNGSFTSPTLLTTKTSTVSGVLTCVIPSLPSGDGYKMKIVSTNPVDTSKPSWHPIGIGNPPLIQAYNTGPGCEGDTMKVGVNEFSHATWETWNGPGLLPNFYTKVATLFDVKLSDSGKYYVSVQDYGCKSLDSTYLTIHPNPVHAIGTTNSPVCEGDSLKLFGNIDSIGAINIWFNPNNTKIVGKDLVLPKALLADSGRYVLATTLNGCTAKDSTYVIIKPTPKPNASVNNPLCLGDKLMLTTNCNLKNAALSWVGPRNFICNSADTIIDNVTFSYNGIYTITAAKNGCSATDTLAVQVNPYPVVPKATHNNPVCVDGELLLSANSITQAAKYNWTGPNGFNINGYNATISSLSTNYSGSYILTADINGCIKADTLNINVSLQPPLPDITSNSPLHVGSTLHLNLNNAISGIAYKWTGPDGFSTTEANPVINNTVFNNSGRYLIEANLNGCYTTNYIDVVVSDVVDTGIVVLYPNANDGNFTVKLLLHEDQQLGISITDVAGHQLYSERSETQNNVFEKQFNLKGRLASGIYTFRIIFEGTTKSIPFVVGRQ
jgi:hypothetical protein